MIKKVGDVIPLPKVSKLRSHNLYLRSEMQICAVLTPL